MKTRILLCSLALAATPAFCADQLTQSTFTEVIKDVNVVAQQTKAASPAKPNDLFKYPDLVRTGADSRAELTAPDKTITRVGANTVFSFRNSGREINLEQGSILFHAPSGKGGGAIKSGGASAAVAGTTIIVAATPITIPNTQNGFKVIVLEGTAKVTLDNGKSITLKAGQMVFILPGQTSFGPVLDINLSKLVAGSNLINGFSNPLASLVLIQQAIVVQNKQIESGRAKDTGVPADNFVQQQHNLPGNGYDGIDNNNLQIGVVGAVLDNVRFPTEPQRPPKGQPPGPSGQLVGGQGIGTGGGVITRLPPPPGPIPPILGPGSSSTGLIMTRDRIITVVIPQGPSK